MVVDAKRRGVVIGSVRKLVYNRFILPIIQSTGSMRQVNWGVAIGVFFALTPTVGVQMYTVALLWAFCRYVLNTNFNLTVALAMVWISNPLTMIPLYYLFLVSGYTAMSSEDKLSFAHFDSQLSAFNEMENAWDSVAGAFRFLILDLGWPMVVGSMFFAIPGAIISYWLSDYLLSRYRQQRLKKFNFVNKEAQPIDENLN